MEASGGIVVDTGNRSSLFAGEDIMIVRATQSTYTEEYLTLL